MPLAEPVTWALDGYLLGVTPPGRRDPEQLAAAIRGVHLAWRDAWRILRGGAPVATSHRVGPVHAADQTVPAQRQAHLADEVLWGSWVSGLRDGILRVPGLAEEEVADLAGSGDVIGIAYEGAIAVTGEGAFRPYPPDVAVAESGWAPWPEGLAVTLRRVADELPGRPVLVSSHGVGTADDEWRGDLLRETVDVLAAARRRRDRPARLVPSQRHRRLRGTPRLLGPLRALRPGPQRQGQLAPLASGHRGRPAAERCRSAAAPEGGPRADRLLVEPLRQVQALEHELDGAGHGGR